MPKQIGSTGAPIARNQTRSSRYAVPMVELKVDAEIDFQARLAMEGVEGAAIVGAKGTGKTEAVKRVIGRISREEMLKTAGEPVGEIVLVTASDATGAKTLIVDVYNELMKTRLTASAVRGMSTKDLVDAVASHCASNSINLLVIDEAQKANAHNLDQVREIPDRARDHGHVMGIMVIGNPELRNALAACGELGQRIGTVIVMPFIDRAFIDEHLEALHPGLAALRAKIGRRAWAPLEEQLMRKVDGKLRRLATILANVSVMMDRLQRPADAEILGVAIKKLAEEK
jgi:DNA transposition AAA+ family ATPase